MNAEAMTDRAVALDADYLWELPFLADDADEWWHAVASDLDELETRYEVERGTRIVVSVWSGVGCEYVEGPSVDRDEHATDAEACAAVLDMCVSLMDGGSA